MYSEPETEEHIKGKQALFEWAKKQDGVTDVILEGWISETKQRPDIMFKQNGKQCVIEFQCSPLSTKYLERHELYQAAGIKDIWVLGTEKYNMDFDGRTRRKAIEQCVDIYFDVHNNIFSAGLSGITYPFRVVEKYSIGRTCVCPDLVELNAAACRIALKDSFLQSYIDEDVRLYNQKKQRDDLIKRCESNVELCVRNLNARYSSVKHHCTFTPCERFNGAPYLSKIQFKSNVTEVINFFVKENGIDVCVPTTYRRPYFGRKKGWGPYVIHGWNTCVKNSKTSFIEIADLEPYTLESAIAKFVTGRLQREYKYKCLSESNKRKGVL